MRIAERRAGTARAVLSGDAVARTSDTPGFRGMTFFEVHARSVINRVPEASRMPVPLDDQPVAGAALMPAVYCASGDTPILMADGRTRPLADVRPCETPSTAPIRRRLATAAACRL